MKICIDIIVVSFNHLPLLVIYKPWVWIATHAWCVPVFLSRDCESGICWLSPTIHFTYRNVSYLNVYIMLLERGLGSMTPVYVWYFVLQKMNLPNHMNIERLDDLHISGLIQYNHWPETGSI